MEKLILTASFDGNRTVWAPLSGFSAAARELPAVESWFLRSDGRGKILSRWPMPYRQSGEIALLNVSDEPCA